jgi:hypothetical protein
VEPGPGADSDYEIFVVQADGTGLWRVTNNDFSDRYVSWAPPAPSTEGSSVSAR